MRLLIEDTLCLVVDVQERLIPAMPEETLVARILKLIDGLKVLGVPFLISEQYPKGLGPTLGPILERLPEILPWPKVAFSCCDEPHLLESLLASGRKNIVVCGVEAHVCVQQTVIDLVALGFQPVVAADAVASRDPADVTRSLDRMRAEGALITGIESLLFELLRAAGTERFKAISKLVK